MKAKKCNFNILTLLIQILHWWKYYVPFVLFVALLLTGEIVSPGYLSLGHILHLFTLAAPLGIMTIGQTFVILSGNEDVDFSTGANASLAIVLAALLLQRQSIFVAMFATVGAGALAGAINGIGTRVVSIPPLIMTFGSAMLLYGVGQAITKGMSIGTATPLLTTMALGRVAGIPYAFIIWMSFLLLFSILLHNTVYGRWLYASGSNARAARVGGISNAVVGITAYIFSGALSAFAGLLYLGRFTIPSGFRMAEIYTLPCIMAVILGGTNFAGGEGSLFGTIGSVLFLTALDSFFSIFNIAQAWRNVMNGALLVFILLFYARRTGLRL